MLTLERVAAGYGRIPALKGVDVRVQAGELVAVQLMDALG